MNFKFANSEKMQKRLNKSLGCYNFLDEIKEARKKNVNVLHLRINMANVDYVIREMMHLKRDIASIKILLLSCYNKISNTNRDQLQKLTVLRNMYSRILRDYNNKSCKLQKLRMSLLKSKPL
ncbi:hypothetical protein A3Q56_01137 [Intoshia linei]|uniref:Uncharacterized protein n=1 Tax=Intoshia linei TaxID=1819745 RepID=A0A177BBT6_9BILA|nr:hypothetical protein A3Q56_01137 [Intoshia linei]